MKKFIEVRKKIYITFIIGFFFFFFFFFCSASEFNVLRIRKHRYSSKDRKHDYFLKRIQQLWTADTLGDPQPHTRTNNVPPNMLLGHNSNVGITNGVSVKAEPNYMGNSRFMYGTDDNVLEARNTIGDASVSSFSCLESDPHQLNGTLVNDGTLFGMLGPMPQNFGLSDSTPDFTNSSDMLDNFSRSAFLSSDRDSFLDSHSSTLEHQGENKRLDIPGFEDFGSES
ncbi:putative angiotensin-converting enzyme 2 [Helianthus annuus]|nr:putative angiotensin-converting enzyme 2 [Helianthus annuus]